MSAKTAKRFFIDCEFIEDGRTIDLISIGAVCEDGREFYAQNAECKLNRASEWVQTNVFPSLYALKLTEFGWARTALGLASWIPSAEIRARLLAFVGDDTPEWWGYYSAYDHVALCQLFGRMIDLPKGWPFLTRDVKQLAEEIGFEGDFYQLVPPVGTAHNALDDARWTRLVWERLHEVEREHLYVPGDWVCPKCSFRLHKRVMSATDLSVGVDASAEPEPCPNDGVMMERLAWKQDATEANRVALDLVKENRRLRERLDELELDPLPGSSPGACS